MKVVEYSLDLSLMSVGIDPLYSAQADRMVNAELIKRLEEKRYGQAPVLTGESSVVGLISLEDLVECHASGQRIRLDSGKIDTTTLPQKITVGELLSCFGKRRCALVKGEDDAGEPRVTLLTISDLNKPPLRHFLYKVLFRLETDLAYLIADRIHDPKDWIVKLPEDSQAKVLGYWEIQKRNDIELAVGPLFSCTLTDLSHIVLNHEGIRKLLGYKKRKEEKRDLYGIIDIRNRVMHPVRPLVSNPTSVENLHKACKAIDDVLARIKAASPAGIEHRLTKVT